MSSITPPIKIIECPRDAMQGMTVFIPTNQKIDYIQQLLKIGFDTIDFGSFVSPKIIPQLKDTEQVLDALDLNNSCSKLLIIVANLRGAKKAVAFDKISYLGFPLSLSETFQRNNTNKSLKEAFNLVEELQALCERHDKNLVVYLSMGFGNPYGDQYNKDYVIEFVDKLVRFNIKEISLADTIGVANESSIETLFSLLTQTFKGINFGVHLHSDRDSALAKIDAAYRAGCRRFDGAINGFGGCPLAHDKLVGNIATERILEYLQQHYIDIDKFINREELYRALNMAPNLFLGKA
ncbi:MAG TPA: hydroxymethylglutaryl-CoA lyase [Cyclobacteriaceae bacterium]